VDEKFHFRHSRVTDTLHFHRYREPRVAGGPLPTQGGDMDQRTRR